MKKLGLNSIFKMMAVCAGGCLVFAAITTVIDVSMRGILNAPLSGAVEMVQIATGMAAFLSFPFCFHEMEHVTANLLNPQGKAQKIIHFFSSTISTIFCLFLAWGSVLTLIEKLGTREMTVDLSIPLSALYVVIAIATVVGVLAVLHAMFSPPSDHEQSDLNSLVGEQ